MYRSLVLYSIHSINTHVWELLLIQRGSSMAVNLAIGQSMSLKRRMVGSLFDKPLSSETVNLFSTGSTITRFICIVGSEAQE